MIYLGLCILVICLIVAFSVDIGYMFTTIFSAIVISCGVICFTVCLIGEFILSKLKTMNGEYKNETTPDNYLSVDSTIQEHTEQK